MALMSENGGAKLESCRKIWRKMRKQRDAIRDVVEAKKKRPGYDANRCLSTETLRSYDASLAGWQTPVGCLKDHWVRACEIQCESNPLD